MLMTASKTRQQSQGDTPWKTALSGAAGGGLGGFMGLAPILGFGLAGLGALVGGVAMGALVLIASRYPAGK
jgi:hypothetical protein